MQTVMRNATTFGETSTTITIEVDKLYTSRNISNKMIRLDIDLIGTMEDMIKKAERVNSLTNEMYKMLSEVSKNVLESNEANDCAED